ncbi:hypothetical protein [Roseivivax sp. CAU 1753]
MAFFDTLNTRLRNHARYNRTLRQLEALPFGMKVDLDINGREEKVARNAVYG